MQSSETHSEGTACVECSSTSAVSAWIAARWICPACGFANPMPARERLALVADPSAPLDLMPPMQAAADPLGFVDQMPYPDRLARARQQTGLEEAFLAARCTIGGMPTMLGAFDFAFMGGTMSSTVGDAISRLFEQAADERRAVVICTSSGGARMQEGTLSLFQMTRTTAAVVRFREARRPFVTVLCHPTLGGVAASFATQADVLLAEPGARIGFAGPRVVEELLGHKLPADFQRAEFLLERGFIDRVVPRLELHGTLAKLLPMLAGGQPG